MEVSRHASVKAFQESAMGRMYDVDSKTAWVKFTDEETAMKIVLVY